MNISEDSHEGGMQEGTDSMPQYELDRRYPQPPLPDNGHIRLFKLQIDLPGHQSASQEASTGLADTDVDTDQARLDISLPIKLLQGSTEILTNYKLSLRTFPMASAPDYYALSYRWGDDINSGIPGIRFSSSLLECLPRLAIQRPGYWWVDAICINQDDEDEKLEQIKLMGEIYANAKCVIAYIGEHDESSRDAISLALQVHNAFADGKLHYTGVNSRFRGSRENALKASDFPNEDDPAWANLQKLLSRPYFSRIWMVQELALSQKATVLCGSTFFNWTVVNSVGTWMEATGLSSYLLHASATDEEALAFIKARLISTVRQAKSAIEKNFSTKGPRLSNLLIRSASLDATDPRDKIMGMLGLLQKPNSLLLALTPNLYQKKIPEFYTEVTAMVIANEKSLNILSITGLRNSNSYTLPSWVPDYSESGYSIFQATNTPSLNAGGGMPLVFETHPSSGTLTVNVKLLDEVLLVSDASTRDGLSVEKTVRSWLDLMASFTGMSLRYIHLALADPKCETSADVCQQFNKLSIAQGTKVFTASAESTREFIETLPIQEQDCPSTDELKKMIDQFDAFWRTTIKDTMRGEFPAPSSYRTAFLRFVELSIFESAEEEGWLDGMMIPCDRWLPKDSSMSDIERFSEGLDDKLDIYLTEFRKTGTYYKFFITKSGRFGLGNLALKPGHIVAVAGGSDDVLILQPEGSVYEFVGTSYVHGLMTGQGALSDDVPWVKVQLI